MKMVLPMMLPPLVLIDSIKNGSSMLGNNKSQANAIQNDMMMHKYGPDTGAKMAQFKDDYNQAANDEKRGIEGEHTTQNKAKLHQQLNELHQAGALDDATHYELGHMIDTNNMSSIDIDDVLVDHRWEKNSHYFPQTIILKIYKWIQLIAVRLAV